MRLKENTMRFVKTISTGLAVAIGVLCLRCTCPGRPLPRLLLAPRRRQLSLEPPRLSPWLLSPPVRPLRSGLLLRWRGRGRRARFRHRRDSWKRSGAALLRACSWLLWWLHGGFRRGCRLQREIQVVQPEHRHSISATTANIIAATCSRHSVRRGDPSRLSARLPVQVRNTCAGMGQRRRRRRR